MRPPMARQPAGPDASRSALLRLVLRDLGGETVGLLHYLLDRWPSQKARTPCLILDALCQPPDDPRCLTKGRARLRRIARCLIHPPQRRLDLPAFAWQPEVCCQPCCLAQVADGLLALSIPRGKPRPRLQVGQAEARGRPQTFSESVHGFSRLAFISPTQYGLCFILAGEIQQDRGLLKALAEGHGLYGIRVGLFPLPCQGTVHAQLRQD